tara:strand:+ start:683 stop:1036 length:354 start_codon:yes stop_codon:yes gene_type:complete
MDAITLEKVRTRPGEYVELCFLPNRRSTWDKYVTWVVDEDGNRFWGEYVNTIAKAAASFARRTYVNGQERSLADRFLAKPAQQPMCGPDDPAPRIVAVSGIECACATGTISVPCHLH